MYQYSAGRCDNHAMGGTIAAIRSSEMVGSDVLNDPCFWPLAYAGEAPTHWVCAAPMSWRQL